MSRKNTLSDAERGWPATKPALRDTKSLHPNPHNPRRHTPEQIEEIGRSYDANGFTMPILVDEKSVIIAGEGRWRMALGRSLPRVPVIRADGWTEAQKRAYQLVDNRMSELSDWDTDALDQELAELAKLGIEPTTLGFEELDEEETGSLEVREVATAEVADEFWISVRGKLKYQAEMLSVLQAAASGLEGVSVDLDTIKVD
jgi:ParB-like chromosome segregation protein Spo0J